jgi:hypothetical protein
MRQARAVQASIFDLFADHDAGQRASQAYHEKVETGKVVRLDTTATAALIPEPSDSSLLWRSVRVKARPLKAIGHPAPRNLRRAAKKGGARDRICPRSSQAGPELPSVDQADQDDRGLC